MKPSSACRRLACFALALALAIGSLRAADPKKILLVTVTTGFRHSSIATAEQVIAQIGKTSHAFVVADYARQPDIKVPQKPNAPSKPKEPAGDADARAQTRFAEDLRRFEAASTRYEQELAQWNSRQDEVKAARAEYDRALQASLAKLHPDNLKNFDGVIFANTTGDLPLPDRQGFIDWVNRGKGFVAMHSGSDTFHGFRPYIEMLGGEFETHGAQVGVECLVQDLNHPATKHFGESFCIEQEEIYLIKSFDRTKVHSLLALDKHPNRKKEAGFFPIAWCKEFGQGKVFYTSLGHREDVWENPRYQKHILGGIKWALSLEPGDAASGQ
jgi:type 1 glutamine amidotransferase